MPQACRKYEVIQLRFFLFFPGVKVRGNRRWHQRRNTAFASPGRGFGRRLNVMWLVTAPILNARVRPRRVCELLVFLRGN